MIILRTLNLYKNLQAIKKKLEVGENNQYTAKQMKSHSTLQALKIGNKIDLLVEKESIFKKPPSPKTVRKEKIRKLGFKQ